MHWNVGESQRGGFYPDVIFAGEKTNPISSNGQTFEENSTLEGILADLIIPAVKRKELALREKGLISLGLCCLIAKVGSLLAQSGFMIGLSLTSLFEITANGYQFIPAFLGANPISSRDLKDPRPSDCI